MLSVALVANLNREDNQFLADTVDIVRAFLRERPEDTTGLEQAVDGNGPRVSTPQVFVRILDEHGQAIVATPGMSAVLADCNVSVGTGQECRAEPGYEMMVSSGGSHRVLTAGAPVLDPPGSARRTIQVALNQAHELTLLGDYRRRLGWVLSIAFVFCTDRRRRHRAPRSSARAGDRRGGEADAIQHAW